MNNIIRILSKEYNFNFEEACEKVKRCINHDAVVATMSEPFQALQNEINQQKQKEQKSTMWDNSQFKDIVSLQQNNVGIIGESTIQTLCKKNNINCEIDGTKTKKEGGGDGDGTIKKSTVEIKTAHQGKFNGSFQHELGECPWNADYMIFFDIAPESCFLTIFKNYTESEYKMIGKTNSGLKCEKYFPTKTITWRKNKGCFKLDTTYKINEKSVKLGHSIHITNETSLNDVGKFIENAITN